VSAQFALPPDSMASIAPEPLVSAAFRLDSAPLAAAFVRADSALSEWVAPDS